MANIVKFKQLKILPNNDMIIIEIDENMLKDDTLQHVNFDMLIHSHISSDSYENSPEGRRRINALINSGTCAKTLILNTDDPNWQDIVVDLENTYLIAYGLNNKATVTASSIESSKNIGFCYCLQRSLTSYNNEVIEPMEIPIIAKVFGQYNVYNSLASITAALLCGIDVGTIKSSLGETNIFDTGIKILYENGYMVIDNICDNYSGFETGFEAIQHLPYNNIYLVFDLNLDGLHQIGERLVELLSVWCANLKMNKVYCLMPSGSNDAEDFVRTLNNNLLSFGTVVEFLENPANIEGLLNFLQESDMLLFFCSSKLNYVREKIIEILDRRILGNISGDAD
jgi:UDP-N-acetylmuramoyl-L-alanyl-D-glutamate--2,6-diaminopimelate ligase